MDADRIGWAGIGGEKLESAEVRMGSPPNPSFRLLNAGVARGPTVRFVACQRVKRSAQRAGMV